MVQLSDALVAALDREASRRSTSRSELIRRALREFLSASEQAAIGTQIVEGYTRLPPATPDEWGDPAEVTDQATADLLHRLDAEERRAGHEPW